MDLDVCVHGDALTVLKALPDGCIDLYLTDPPWGTSRLTLDANGRPPVDVWRQVKRTLKPDGWLLCFGTIPMFADILSAGMTDAWSYVWAKPGATLNRQPHLRPAIQHETIHVSHKGGKASDRYFDAEALRTYGHPNYRRRALPRKPSTWHADYGGMEPQMTTEITDGSRSATTILEFGAKNRMPHRERDDFPTQKPHPLLAYLIPGFCPPDGVVCDPYAGSGGTLIAARAKGRRWIGVEIDAHWHGRIVAKMRSVLDYGDEKEEGPATG